MIYDCFMFFNELDLLELRLQELDPVVDLFVLCEATRTFQGSPKPLLFDENRGRFAPWAKKIRHLVYDHGDVECIAWEREIAQRNFMRQGISDAKPDDLIMLSDVDEIPNPDDMGFVDGKGRFSGLYHYYWLNCRALDYYCNHPVVCPVNQLPRSFQRLRRCKFPIVGRAWHFSYLGGVDAIRKKIRAFSHVEYNTDFWIDADRIILAMKARVDLFGRRFKYEIVPIDESFPRTVWNNQERWKEYICDPKSLCHNCQPAVL